MEPNGLFPALPSGLHGLAEIAENLWWTWHPAARMIFKRISRSAWKNSGHNPDKMLRSIEPEKLQSVLADSDFMARYQSIYKIFKTATSRPCDTAKAVAYFSAEYGLHHSLPFYAGGLGFLAGDHLKECSDLGVPAVGIGFMYPEGYVSQYIREDGWQEDLSQHFDREAASINQVLDKNGKPVIISIDLIDPPIHLAVWKIDVGRIRLYLMDTDIALNDPWNRKISARLYVSDIEQRLRQEIVLGIGGAEMLNTIGVAYNAVHLNEGHAAFVQLERIRDRVLSGATFAQACNEVRRKTLFTTHTPVSAGHDVFPFHLMEKYFHNYWPSLGIGHDAFLKQGLDPLRSEAGFNMTALALRTSTWCNGVSQQHAEVSRKMWQSLWPDRTDGEVPIGHVTNGIHVPTWIEPKLRLLFNDYLGKDWLDSHDNQETWCKVDEIPDEKLWNIHQWLKIKLIHAIREYNRQAWCNAHTSPHHVIAGGAFLDPTVLTIGFARRFATYKRADLVFQDIEQLRALLNDSDRPIQILFAGKAHPADIAGKRVLQGVYSAAQDSRNGGRICFVINYGEQLAQYLVHGVDVWLNNPLPPYEACGTSGMKAAINGVPHVSIADGWWLEGFNGQNGWIFGGKTDDTDRDLSDANELYELIRRHILPAYYDLSEDGVPLRWVSIMKAAIKGCGARFSARRMVKEYRDRYYAKMLGQDISAVSVLRPARTGRRTEVI